MLTYAIGYLASLVTCVAVDMVWLATVAPRFYRPTLGDIAISGVNLPPAILFYAIYPVGVLIFAISPAVKSDSLIKLHQSSRLEFAYRVGLVVHRANCT